MSSPCFQIILSAHHFQPMIDIPSTCLLIISNSEPTQMIKNLTVLCYDYCHMVLENATLDTRDNVFQIGEKL